MPLKVTAIFDIGKTNKKFFLFDEQLNEVFREYTRFPEIPDDDGFDSDDLAAIQRWMLDTFQSVSHSGDYEIQAVNFSAYGATLVHLDQNLEPCTPLYNYTKPYPPHILKMFTEKYGPVDEWSLQTSSPSLGMLNAGLQIFWLKHEKPALFARIRHSLFLPQYFSFLFSKMITGEYTGIGCHTGIWDYNTQQLHSWFAAEGFSQLLAPINAHAADLKVPGTDIRVGTGIHDSSAALIPYLSSNTEPFILLSTGTWSICLNPFNDLPLTKAELEHDCLCYLRRDGQPVKASRLFLGHEYNQWMKKMASEFNVDASYHKSIVYDEDLYVAAERSQEHSFYGNGDNSRFRSFEEAYHHLMNELGDLQVQQIRRVLQGPEVRTMYLDGGFVDNRIFIRILANKLPDLKIIPSDIPLGSAVGAAMCVNRDAILQNGLIFSAQE